MSGFYCYYYYYYYYYYIIIIIIIIITTARIKTRLKGITRNYTNFQTVKFVSQRSMIIEDSSLLIYGTTQSNGSVFSESSKFHHNTKLPKCPSRSTLALLREYYVLKAQSRAYNFTDKYIKQWLKRHFRNSRNTGIDIVLYLVLFM